MHFAGLKSVPDSIKNPRSFYDNNVIGTCNLLFCMEIFEVRNIIFSSSASVYGLPEVSLLKNSKKSHFYYNLKMSTHFCQKVPIMENAPLRPISPYGETKLIVEKILEALVNFGDVPKKFDYIPKESYGYEYQFRNLISEFFCKKFSDLVNDVKNNPEKPKKNKKWTAILLRYFNPCGAHSSGFLGERPKDKQFANLMPIIAKVKLMRPIILTSI